MGSSLQVKQCHSFAIRVPLGETCLLFIIAVEMKVYAFQGVPRFCKALTYALPRLSEIPIRTLHKDQFGYLTGFTIEQN